MERLRLVENLHIQSFDPGFIKAMLAEQDNRVLVELLRLAIDNNDSLAWASLLKIHDGVGDTFFKYLYEYAQRMRTTFASALLTLHRDNFPEGPRSSASASKRITAILEWLGDVALPQDSQDENWGQWIVDFVQADAFVPNPSADFQKLLQDLDTEDNKDKSLHSFIAQIEPRGKDLAQARSDGVRIMTMGGSKGLTVRATILVGVDDGLIPRPNSNLAEERRVLYVAMTRSTEYLYCTWANKRYGPQARAGSGAQQARQFCHFLRGGPIDSQNGQHFIAQRFAD